MRNLGSFFMQGPSYILRVSDRRMIGAACVYIQLTTLEYMYS